MGYIITVLSTAKLAAKIENFLMMNASKAMINTSSKTFFRGKKTTAVSPSTQRVVNQLSALSASRKQPKLIKLSREDLIKHRTIQNAWKTFTASEQRRRNDQLNKQYKSMSKAMETLKQLDTKLYEVANVQDTDNLYPLEMRVPTDYPPNQPWVYNYAK